jgi:hypothetical protein
MRTIDSAVIAQFYKQQGGFAVPALVAITHGVAGYTNPLLLVNNTEAVTYEGATYQPYPFTFDPPDLSTDRIAHGKFSICAVDQAIASIVRSTETPPTLVFKAVCVIVGTTTVIEPVASWSFTLRDISGNEKVISATLEYENRLQFDTPPLEYLPQDFPGVH